MALVPQNVCVVDTDVMIDALHGNKAAVAKLSSLRGDFLLATTAYNSFELYHGAFSLAHQAGVENIDGFLESFLQLPFSQTAARRAGRIAASLEHGGQLLPHADVIIAAITLEHGGVLLTGNRKHFSRITGLTLL